MTPDQHGDLAAFVTGIWRTQVRFIGAGAMAVAAIWSLVRTIGPILGGLKQVAARQVTRGAGRPDRPRYFPATGSLA